MATSEQIDMAARSGRPAIGLGGMGEALLADPLTDEAERAQAAAAVRRLAPPDWVETALEALGLTEPEPAPRRRGGPVEHGTYAGWMAHRRRGIAMCDACHMAQLTYRRERRAAARREVSA